MAATAEDAPVGITAAEERRQPAEHAAAPPESEVPPPACKPRAYANDGFVLTAFGEVSFSADTTRLLRDSGGVAGLERIAYRFYELSYGDAHLFRFLGGLQQPLRVHARRFAIYIGEVMGATTAPWTDDLRVRSRKRIVLAHGMSAVVTSRLGAHSCAWHSVDREPERVGRRFKLDDCRVWMRLLFWAARDCGYDEAAPLFRYLVKFVGHFIAVYETSARQFARLESRWSACPGRTAAYLAQAVDTDGVEGRRRRAVMGDVVGVPLREAMAELPADERRAGDAWLFEGAPIAGA
jgi:hypothetical protein